MSENSKLRFPCLATRDIKWLHGQFGLCFGIMKQKGYTDAEAVRLAWNILDDTDWKNYGEGLTIVQRAERVLSKAEADVQNASLMLISLRNVRDGYNNRYFNIFVDTDDEKRVCGALMMTGIKAEDVSTGEAYVRKPGNPIFFRIDGYYCPEVGRRLSEVLHCLVLTEDAWDNNASDIFVDGRDAVLGTDYTAETEVRDSDEPDSFDTDFTVRRMDGTCFAAGGCGAVDLNNIDSYLKPFGFDFDGFCKEFGYQKLSAKGVIRRAV